jgi:hypothetical protein
LPVPREPLRLVGDPADPRLLGKLSGADRTEAMKIWAARRLEELRREGIRGFVFKSGSPSCGAGGLFALAFARRFPRLPAPQERALADRALLERFLDELARASWPSARRGGS